MLKSLTCTTLTGDGVGWGGVQTSSMPLLYKVENNYIIQLHLQMRPPLVDNAFQ